MTDDEQVKRAVKARKEQTESRVGVIFMCRGTSLFIYRRGTRR